MSIDSPDIDRQAASTLVSLDEPLASSAACLDTSRCVRTFVRADSLTDLHPHDSPRTLDADGNATAGVTDASTAVIAG